jgi:hypothetical protein
MDRKAACVRTPANTSCADPAKNSSVRIGAKQLERAIEVPRVDTLDAQHERTARDDTIVVRCRRSLGLAPS